MELSAQILMNVQKDSTTVLPTPSAATMSEVSPVHALKDTRTKKMILRMEPSALVNIEKEGRWAFDADFNRMKT